jgi:hypothetical protein
VIGIAASTDMRKLSKLEKLEALTQIMAQMCDGPDEAVVVMNVVLMTIMPMSTYGEGLASLGKSPDPEKQSKEAMVTAKKISEATNKYVKEVDPERETRPMFPSSSEDDDKLDEHQKKMRDAAERMEALSRA